MPNSHIVFTCYPNLASLQYLYAWISAQAPKLSDSSAWTISALRRRWRRDSDVRGKQDDASVGLQHGTFSDDHSSWCKYEQVVEAFCPACPDVFMIKWLVRPLGTWYCCHYLSTEPTLHRGKLSALIRLVCSMFGVTLKHIVQWQWSYSLKSYFVADNSFKICVFSPQII